MLNAQELTDQGYNKFTDSFKQEQKPFYLGTYQKGFRDDLGKKYFINIEHWDLRSYGLTNKESFHAYVQFKSHSSPTFEISLHIEEKMSLQDVEAWFENAWLSMKADYYEKY